ncbi:DNA topoisomerase 2-binding protein 1-A [Stylophora pistillata]|uniref:DNA topoisomerase 2-binding protein 1-A n=1 Tax=Stylophora pistillata TaxID=50429 RepID=A0A2B4S6U9_STYPI|nr:DNA topoisomerase 2-binding protein 1-A [Stylophora pistillata]
MASDDENTLRFISVDESKEENLLRASEASKEYDLNSEWISASDLENIDLETQRSVYVLENFEGESFEYLKKSKCRIVGPQCILSCLQTQTPLPNVQYPVYGVAMLGTAISCTSVPRQERDRLYDLIHLMGGIVMKDFTSAVTHLVAGEVGSKKYKVACSFNKPILLPQWVYKCWELSQDKHVCATDEQFMEFKCPTFKGITLCVTGIDAEKRKEIKKLVTQHGGTYSGALDMNTCTHLLVDEPRGEKYEYARRWNLHCVCTQWFYDSVQTGLCQDESSYYTQPNEENNSSQAGARFSGLIKGNTSKSSTEKKISNKAAQAAYKSAQKHGNKDLISGCGRYSRLSNQSKTDVSRIGETHISDPDGSDFDVRIQPGNMFLDGCKIYLSGFSGQNLEKLRKIINSGGGTRFNQINEIVSHVIVGNRIDADIDLLRNCDFQVFIVSVQWILDSAREGKKLSEEKYLCSDLLQREDLPLSCKENEDPAKTLSKATKNVSVLQPSASEKNKKDAKAKPKEDQCDGDDDYDDVFIQYLPQNEDQGSEPGQNLPQTDTTAQLKECSSFSADPDATLDNEEEEEAPQDGLLSGKFFTVAGFSSEHLTHLWQLLESNGGKAVSGGQTADYAVLPMNKVPEEDLQAKQLVTFCWLEQSLACDHLLAPEDGFLFKPFSIPEARKPLSGCVLTISQFTGVERDHIYQLAELLGAHCQEYFVRKASGNFKASTHLLCQDPDGNKYKAAMKWNIPVVSRDWLFACAAGGTLVPTNEYPVGSDKKVVVDANVCPSEELRVGKADAKDTSQDHILKSEEGELPIETNNEVSALHVQNVNNGGGDQGSTEKQPVKRPSMYFRPFRPSFDLADVMEELASPVCSSLRGRKSRGSRNSFPLGDFFAENIKQTLKKLGTVAPRTRKGDEENDDDETFDDIQQEREENGEPHQQGILVGVILSVSKKLAQQQTEIFNLASSLGADYRRLYDGSCTHLIHQQGPSNDKSKEYAQAKARGIHIVSPHWLYSCQEKNERVDETMYPHTFNPKLSLSVVTTGRRMTRSSQAATTEQEMSPQKKRKSLSVKVNESSETKKLSKMGSVPEELAGEEKAEEGDIAEEVQQDPQMGPATLESLEAREDFKRQLEAIMDATKMIGPGNSYLRLDVSDVKPNVTSLSLVFSSGAIKNPPQLVYSLLRILEI